VRLKQKQLPGRAAAIGPVAVVRRGVHRPSADAGIVAAAAAKLQQILDRAVGAGGKQLVLAEIPQLGGGKLLVSQGNHRVRLQSQ
jgi:hypothetical protein